MLFPNKKFLICLELSKRANRNVFLNVSTNVINVFILHFTQNLRTQMICLKVIYWHKLIFGLEVKSSSNKIFFSKEK